LFVVKIWKAGAFLLTERRLEPYAQHLVRIFLRYGELGVIDDYEKKHYPIEAPDPIEAIKIRMEEMHLNQKDISTAFGGRNRASEVLNKKRKLTIEMIRNLTSDLKLSPGLLIKDYQLAK